jgi:hypothetical protein
MRYIRFVLGRDTIFYRSRREILASDGVEPLPLPLPSPNLNAFAERNRILTLDAFLPSGGAAISNGLF